VVFSCLAAAQNRSQLTTAGNHSPGTRLNKEWFLLPLSKEIAAMKRIVGEFVKQKWGGRKSNEAIEVGVVQFDATQAILKRDLAFLNALTDGDDSSDEIGRECVQWSGPCDVRITDAIAEFFELGEDETSRFLMERITQEQLDEARSTYLKEEEVGTLVLELRVTYSLNGESIESMRSNLEHMVRRAIGEGLLTGETGAEVDSYESNIEILPAETIIEEAV
jgi:hypothetical protein